MNDGPRQAKAASSDERIIEATLVLIATDGLGAMTMRRIAEAADVSRQTLYNHYPDIDSIVAEAIRRHNRESIELLERSMHVVDQPTAKLEQLVRHVVSNGAHGHHAAGIRHGLSAPARVGLGEYDDALDRCIRQVLEEGMQSGAFRRDLAPDIDAALVRHMLNGLAELAAAQPNEAALLAATGASTILATVERR